jgi:hypothetical protein
MVGVVVRKRDDTHPWFDDYQRICLQDHKPAG